jgi:hypothetical protein
MTRLRLTILTLIFTSGAMIGAALYGGGRQAAANSHLVWKWYGNVRFHYAICYPENLLLPQGESENGDGQIFRGKDGARLTVYGRNNALKTKSSATCSQRRNRVLPGDRAKSPTSC